MRRVRIVRELLLAVREDAQQGAPEDICGVPVGRRDADGLVVERVIPTRNGSTQPRTQYLVPAEEPLGRSVWDAERGAVDPLRIES